MVSSSHCQPPLQVPASSARRRWPPWPVVMPSQPWSWVGSAGWLSTANWLQMEFNTGVCREVIQESFPDAVKCLQLPAKLLGAFKTAYHRLENVYRRNKKARTFIHVWLLSVRPNPLLGDLWQVWAGRLQGRCAEPYQAAHSEELMTSTELLSDRLFSKVTILPLALWPWNKRITILACVGHATTAQQYYMASTTYVLEENSVYFSCSKFTWPV